MNHSRLCKKYFLCTDEGEAYGCLGMEIKEVDKQLTLKPPQLIKRTIELLGIIDAKPKSVPVAKPLLGKKSEEKDVDGDSFHHRSAIDVLRCLAGCVRPDTLMAVYQAAKFSTNTKACHNAAVKRIGKHLLGTSNEGLTCEPNADEGLEVFVDADFAGGFNTTNTEDPTSACSRTGFVIKYAGCPIIWKS